MKKFFQILLSDSNKFSTKRFIGLLCLAMFLAYGVMGLIRPFNVHFWIFYVSLANITMWIAFRFMTAEKILKYDVIGKLTKFAPLKEAVDDFIKNEKDVDGEMQPELSGSTETKAVSDARNKLLQDVKEEDLPME